MTNRIPKIIHYCWFGGKPLPEMAQRCINSWKKYCPDYEIKRWDESNFDYNCNQYAKEAYEAKKWAFVSDVARLYALVNCGGIYMDTDVEVIKPLDGLLEYEAVSGFESSTRIQTGLMACREGFGLFAEMLEEYDSIHFIKEDGQFDLTTNVTRITNLCSKYGFVANNTKQTVAGFTLLPTDYLCPKNLKTLDLNITDNTLTIHHFDGSWTTPESKYFNQLRKRLNSILPKWIAKFFTNAIRHIASVVSMIKFRGLIQTYKEIVIRLKK